MIELLPTEEQRQAAREARGRPPSNAGLMAKDPGHARIFNVSHRQMLNHAYAQIGLNALGMSEHGNSIDAEFRWLYAPDNHVCRSSLLTEIGMVAEQYWNGVQMARSVARAICDIKPTVTKGRALIRAWRVEDDQDPVADLTRAIVRAVNAWALTHETLEIDRVTHAMQQALCILSETVSENKLEQLTDAIHAICAEKLITDPPRIEP
jgi:hypothetical protein